MLQPQISQPIVSALLVGEVLCLVVLIRIIEQTTANESFKGISANTAVTSPESVVTVDDIAKLKVIIRILYLFLLHF
jgi:hypothetical protein